MVFTFYICMYSLLAFKWFKLKNDNYKIKPNSKWINLQYFLHTSVRIAKTIIKDKNNKRKSCLHNSLIDVSYTVNIIFRRRSWVKILIGLSKVGENGKKISEESDST